MIKIVTNGHQYIYYARDVITFLGDKISFRTITQEDTDHPTILNLKDIMSMESLDLDAADLPPLNKNVTKEALTEMFGQVFGMCIPTDPIEGDNKIQEKLKKVNPKNIGEINDLLDNLLKNTK